MLLTEQFTKDLVEMAAPSMPAGVKKKRSENFDGVHHIHIDGEHVATIMGTKQESYRYRGGLAEPGSQVGHSTEHGKHYRVYKNDDDISGSWKEGSDTRDHGHPDHAYPTQTHHYIDHQMVPAGKVNRPVTYGSMESAMHHVIAAHRNNQEFGAGHDPKVRWQKALDSTDGVKHNGVIATQHQQAVGLLKSLGHHDLATQVQHKADEHVAATASAGGATKDKLEQWTHDAPRHAETGRSSYNEPHKAVYPDHVHLADKVKHLAGYY